MLIASSIVVGGPVLDVKKTRGIPDVICVCDLILQPSHRSNTFLYGPPPPPPPSVEGHVRTNDSSYRLQSITTQLCRNEP